MPTYDYVCDRCGPFTAYRSLVLFDQPAPCRVCNAQSVRALTVPFSSAQRRRTGQVEGNADYQRLRHNVACLCCHEGVKVRVEETQ